MHVFFCLALISHYTPVLCSIIFITSFTLEVIFYVYLVVISYTNKAVQKVPC